VFTATLKQPVARTGSSIQGAKIVSGNSLPTRSSTREQLRAVLGGRLAQQLLEDAVEMRERLEPDLERDLAHAQVGIQQEILRLFNANAGQVVGEVDAGDLLEHLAEVKRARP
jgi:hypothetical protein